MFRRKHSFRKPDPLILLAVLVSLAVLTTSAVDAAEPFYNSLSLTDLEDREIMLAPIGKHGASMTVSYQTNPYMYEASKTNYSNEPQDISAPTVFLSVKVPW